MKKFTIFTFSSFLVFSATFCIENSTASSPSQPYIGASFDTVYFSGRRGDIYDNTQTLHRSRDTVGFGGTLYSGWTFSLADNIRFSPEFGIGKESSKNTSSKDVGYEVRSILQKKYNLSLNFITSFDVFKDMSFNTLLGFRHSLLSYKVEEYDTTPFFKKKNFNAIGFTIGMGVERKFQIVKLGFLLSHTIYQSKKLEIVDEATNTTYKSSKIPGSTELKIKFSIPI